MKLSVDELLRLACIHADQDRESWLDAMEPCRGDPSYADLIAREEAFLKQLREYRLKRWGKSKLDRTLETIETVDVPTLAKIAFDEYDASLPNPPATG